MCDYFAACQATPFDEAACAAGMMLFLNAHAGLHDLWRTGLAAGTDTSSFPWQLRPKNHMLEHLVLDKVSSVIELFP